MSGIKWIKISTTLFDDEKVKLIQKMPQGPERILFWIQLLTMAGRVNDDGSIYLREGKAFSKEMLAVVTGQSSEFVETTLNLLEDMGMIEVDKKGIIEIVNWEKHQNIEALSKIKEQNRERQRLYRERLKEKQEQRNVTSRDSSITVTHQNKNKNKNNTSPLSVELCEFFISKIKENNPKFKQPNIDQWANDMDKIIRLDKREPEEIKAVIAFCQSDEFWKSNILSPKKLREKFDMLYMKIPKGQRPMAIECKLCKNTGIRSSGELCDCVHGRRAANDS